MRVFAIALGILMAAACSKSSDTESKNKTDKPQPKAATDAAAAKPAVPDTPKPGTTKAKYGADVPGLYSLAEAAESMLGTPRQYVLVTADAIYADNVPKGTDAFPGKQRRLDALAGWLDGLRPKTGSTLTVDDGPTGTKMVLEEGKMGKPDSRRQRGQYSMKRTGPPPQLTKKGVLAQARRSGALGVLRRLHPSADHDDAFYFGKPDGKYNTQPAPKHFAWGPHPKAPMILADKNVPARRVAEVVAALCHHGARLGVARAKDRTTPWAHPVAVGTYEGKDCKGDPNRDKAKRATGRDWPPQGMGLHVTAGGYELFDGSTTTKVERKPGELTKALKKAATKPKYRLLVAFDAGVTVSQLVAVLDAASKALFANVHIGSDWDKAKQGTTERRRLGHGPASQGKMGRGPDVKIRLGAASATGDLHKAIIRRYIQRNRYKIKLCYERQLLVNARLAGTVRTSFTIMPSGDVTNSTATGVSARVASCVAQVIARIKFPKPRGGGVVNVKYPFKFSSTP